MIPCSWQNAARASSGDQYLWVHCRLLTFAILRVEHSPGTRLLDSALVDLLPSHDAGLRHPEQHLPTALIQESAHRYSCLPARPGRLFELQRFEFAVCDKDCIGGRCRRIRILELRGAVRDQRSHGRHQFLGDLHHRLRGVLKSGLVFGNRFVLG